MARPRKSEHEKRIIPLYCDLTLAEKAYVQQQVAAAGLSIAEYTRRRVLGYRVPARAEREATAALVSEINRLGNQVAALGNVTNQVALYCHTDRRIPAEWEPLPNKINDLLRLVEETLERMVSDGA